jgi:hypothetical protein
LPVANFARCDGYHILAASRFCHSIFSPQKSPIDAEYDRGRIAPTNPHLRRSTDAPPAGNAERQSRQAWGAAEIARVADGKCRDCNRELGVLSKHLVTFEKIGTASSQRY